MAAVSVVTRILLGKTVVNTGRLATFSNSGLIKFYSTGTYVN